MQPRISGQPAATIYNYEDLLSDGISRQNGMSGDGVAGGASRPASSSSTTGTSSTPGPTTSGRTRCSRAPLPDGCFGQARTRSWRRRATRAPRPANPTHDPNGGLNNSSSSSPGTSTRLTTATATACSTARPSTQPRNSAFAARWSVVAPCRGLPSATRSPAMSLSRPSCSRRRPEPTRPHQRQRVGAVQHDAGLRPGLDAQVAERLAVRAEPGQCPARSGRLRPRRQPVTFTSYNDASIGGVTNNNPETTPVRATGAASSSATTTRPSPRSRSSSRSMASWSGLNGVPPIAGARRRDVDPQQRQRPVRRRRGPAELEQFLQRRDALQFAAGDHQRQHHPQRRGRAA